MSSSSFESDSDSSSSSNDSLSMTKQLLDEPLEIDSSIYTKMTHNVVQTTAIHVPIIVSHVQPIKKERHLNCKILEWIHDPFSFESHKLFHTSFCI